MFLTSIAAEYGITISRDIRIDIRDWLDENHHEIESWNPKCNEYISAKKAAGEAFDG